MVVAHNVTELADALYKARRGTSIRVAEPLSCTWNDYPQIMLNKDKNPILIVPIDWEF